LAPACMAALSDSYDPAGASISIGEII
jgi:hypothetical protein